MIADTIGGDDHRPEWAKEMELAVLRVLADHGDPPVRRFFLERRWEMGRTVNVITIEIAE